MSDENHCTAQGPGGLKCSRHEDHIKHVTYQEVDGQLYHIAWFACNDMGEPIE